jgi:D-glycero-alpha-D-manno-heptose-7-phosphate kinase
VIAATARCRVDLGGGTLDIWPLGLLHPGSTTVNVAVELPVAVALAPRAAGYAVRQGGEEHVAADAAGLRARPETALAGCVVAALDLPPVAIEVESASPRGAGLGASSALTVALLAAAEALADDRSERASEERARLARDLEARLMGLPTGCQDHLAAQLGGALAIEHAPGGERVRRLAVDLDALGAHLVVAHTGQSHFSAANNWRIVRARLDGEPAIAARFEAIRDAAAALPRALEAGDWEGAGRLVGAEWEARRGLADGIETPAIARLLDLARARGGFGGKACGAGGGGAVAALVPSGRRAEITAAWRAAGALVLDAPPTARGLEVVRR